MAAGGPSQRKISVSALVYSTLGPSLGLLPNEEKVHVPSLNAAGGVEENSAGEEAVGSTASGLDKLTASEGSAPSEIQSEGNEKADNYSLSSNGDLNRLYSSPASSFGHKARLDFKSKAGAGSMSSMEQATGLAPLPKQSSISVEEGHEAPLSPVSKQLQSQISSLGDQPLSPR